MALMGIDLIVLFKYIKEYPRYLKDLCKFCNESKKLKLSKRWPTYRYPLLLDRNSQAASLSEYFWQDLYVAKKILEMNPVRHVDIGSRIDGFISHLACVRDVEVFDIRPLNEKIPNVKFTKFDITNPGINLLAVSDCVTCLHTLEHIGLGRYGDVIDPNGWEIALQSLANLLKPSGSLWISVPVGVQLIQFNAHRVFSPFTVVNQASEVGLELSKFISIEASVVSESHDFNFDFNRVSKLKYALGIFNFIKQ